MTVAAIHQPLADIAARRNIHAQSVARILVDDAPFGPHHRAARGFGQRENIDHFVVVAKQHLAVAGRIKARETTQQGRFSRSRFTDNAQYFAGPQREGNILATDALAIIFGDLIDLQQGLEFGHQTRGRVGRAHAFGSCVLSR